MLLIVLWLQNNLETKKKSLICEGTSYELYENTVNKLEYYFSKIDEYISNSFDNVTENIRSVFFSDTSSIFLHNVSEGEAEGIVKGMKNKSCDFSSYLVKALKFIFDIVSAVLSIIINRSLCSRAFFSSLKVAKVVPIYKGNLKTVVNIYRRISVLPLLSKIFERAVHNQVYKLNEKYKFFSKS